MAAIETCRLLKIDKYLTDIVCKYVFKTIFVLLHTGRFACISHNCTLPTHSPRMGSKAAFGSKESSKNIFLPHVTQVRTKRNREE